MGAAYDSTVTDWFHKALIKSRFYDRLAIDFNGKSKYTIKSDFNGKHSDLTIECESCPDMNIAVKLQSSYLNNSIPSFVLELYSGTNFEKVGWFLDSDSKITHYLFAWGISTKRGDITSADDFYIVRLCLVSKVAILDFLKANNLSDLSKDVILNILNYNGVDTGNKCITTVKSGVDIVWSKHLSENPVNLKLSFNILQQLSNLCIDFRISDGKYEKVPYWSGISFVK